MAKETAEEGEKRKKGAAIAPPSTFGDDSPAVVAKKEKLSPEPEEQRRFVHPKLPQFGKGTSRGLGVAASIMVRGKQ